MNKAELRIGGEALEAGGPAYSPGVDVTVGHDRTAARPLGTAVGIAARSANPGPDVTRPPGSRRRGRSRRAGGQSLSWSGFSLSTRAAFRHLARAALA